MTEAALDYPITRTARRTDPRPVLLDWTADKARTLGKANLAFRHDLHTR